MTRTSATFEMKIKLERAFHAMTGRQPKALVRVPDSEPAWMNAIDDFATKLEAMAGLIDTSLDGEHDRYVFETGDTDIAKKTADLAVEAGFVVVKTANGWSAVSPDPTWWPGAPGAFDYWTTETAILNDEYDGEEYDGKTVFAIYRDRMNYDPSDCLAKQGWTAMVTEEADRTIVTYTHDETSGA